MSTCGERLLLLTTGRAPQGQGAWEATPRWGWAWLLCLPGGAFIKQSYRAEQWVLELSPGCGESGWMRSPNCTQAAAEKYAFKKTIQTPGIQESSMGLEAKGDGGGRGEMWESQGWHSLCRTNPPWQQHCLGGSGESTRLDGLGWTGRQSSKNSFLLEAQQDHMTGGLPQDLPLWLLTRISSLEKCY